MVFTYDTSFGSTRDTLRLLISDTKAETYIFDDAELDKLLALEGDEVYMAAALAFRVAAGDAAKQAVMLTMPGLSLTATEIGKQLNDRADAFEKRASLAAQPGFAVVYSDGDAYIDATVGRGDAGEDAPLNSEPIK